MAKNQPPLHNKYNDFLKTSVSSWFIDAETISPPLYKKMKDHDYLIRQKKENERKMRAYMADKEEKQRKLREATERVSELGLF